MASPPSQPSKEPTSSPLPKARSVSLRLENQKELLLSESIFVSLIDSYNAATLSNSELVDFKAAPQQPLRTDYAYYLIQHLAPFLRLPIKIEANKTITITRNVRTKIPNQATTTSRGKEEIQA